MILIVTNKEDIHPTPVIEHFEKMGIPFFRLNTESLLSDYEFEWLSNSHCGDDFRIKNRHTGLEVFGHDINSVVVFCMETHFNKIQWKCQCMR